MPTVAIFSIKIKVQLLDSSDLLDYFYNDKDDDVEHSPL